LIITDISQENVVDPYSAPSTQLRASYPERIWLSDVPDRPDALTPWELSNDLGAVPGYWAPFNGTTDVPAGTESGDWAYADEQEDLSDALEDRATLDGYFYGFKNSNCLNTDHGLVGRIWKPQTSVCYGLWKNNPLGSLESNFVRKQVNVYTDNACNKFYVALTQWGAFHCIGFPSGTPKAIYAFA
jgi:hypothetical protein